MMGMTKMSGGPFAGTEGFPWGMNGGMAGIPKHGPVQGWVSQNAAQGLAGRGTGITDTGVMANHGALQSSTSLFGSSGDLGSLLGGVFNLAFDLIALLLVIGLIVGAVIFIKRYLFEGGSIEVKSKLACSGCGKFLNPKWNNCPNCGQSRV